MTRPPKDPREPAFRGMTLNMPAIHLDPPTPAQVHAARIAVCEAAHDTDDARALLDALGIGRES